DDPTPVEGEMHEHMVWEEDLFDVGDRPIGKDYPVGIADDLTEVFPLVTRGVLASGTSDTVVVLLLSQRLVIVNRINLDSFIGFRSHHDVGDEGMIGNWGNRRKIGDLPILRMGHGRP